jgi:hypothetical protein
MPGLTAKVFRTFNASYCQQKELEKWDMKKNKSATPEGIASDNQVFQKYNQVFPKINFFYV